MNPDIPTLSALQEKSAWRPREVFDRLEFHGDDVVDLLHRISASELRNLGARELRPALFTDDKGRVIDLVQFGANGDGWELWCGPGRGLLLREWVERWVITEDVRVRFGREGRSVELLDDAALELVADALSMTPPRPGEVAATENVRLLRPRAPRGAGTLLWARDEETLRKAVRTLAPMDEETHRLWRVTRAHVLPGPALEARANPLELGWRPLVSFTKGCFIGQEIVARLDTYEKVRRRTVQLKGRGTAPATAEELRHEGQKRGEVLEAASFGEQTWVLALVSVDHEVDGELAWKEGAGTVSTVPAPESDAAPGADPSSP